MHRGAMTKNLKTAAPVPFDAIRQAVSDLSRRIHAHPELGLKRSKLLPGSQRY